MSDPIIIVGAGQAAASFINTHVQQGTGQSVLLLGEESYPPYERPPLSKKFLSGDMQADELYLRPASWYADNEIEIRLDTRVDRILPDLQQVETTSGELISYESLVLCTGSRARELPPTLSGGLAGIHYLRDIQDSEMLRDALQPGKHLVIIGGGYIGLEVAASARALGVDVTVIEMAERLLQRTSGEETARFLQDLHEQQGVRVMSSTAVSGIHGEDGRVKQVQLQSGELLELDLVLVGIGSIANTELAEAAGIECVNGIAVDKQCRTSAPGVYAAGDCTSFVRGNQRIRLESVQNAVDQGDIVAKVLAGKDEQYDSVPWFWSDQYDCSLQIAGLNQGYKQTVVRGNSDDESFSIWYFADHQLLAVDAINDSKTYMIARKLIEKKISPNKDAVSDLSVNLKKLLRS